MAPQRLTKGQAKRRDQLARQFFGTCNDNDFMVAEKGRNGIVRVEEAVVTKAEYGGAFRKPTLTVIRSQYIYGATYDKSAGAEEVVLHTAFGDITWKIYAANDFILRLFGGVTGEERLDSLSQVLRRTV